MGLTISSHRREFVNPIQIGREYCIVLIESNDVFISGCFTIILMIGNSLAKKIQVKVECK